ncbi:hypothetical protein P4O66_000864 [Electrophorus voltai]|uniref:Uncharacterized protein n=1 Tax=Electrophorus voltai TaxID=2609070 RepID=A0AAD8ZFL2_9TELE|nr:hypothetical protein P4O66_000864 [Electrophorus voltai]
MEVEKEQEKKKDKNTDTPHLHPSLQHPDKQLKRACGGGTEAGKPKKQWQPTKRSMFRHPPDTTLIQPTLECSAMSGSPDESKRLRDAGMRREIIAGSKDMRCRREEKRREEKRREEVVRRVRESSSLFQSPAGCGIPRLLRNPSQVYPPSQVCVGRPALERRRFVAPALNETLYSIRVPVLSNATDENTSVFEKPNAWHQNTAIPMLP